MHYVVVGIFGRYADAEAAVSDLELAGIVGEQVQVISDIDEDSRTANTPGEPSTKFREPLESRMARLFGAGGLLEKREVRDLSREQPDYIDEQEFCTNQIKQGGAVMIVRTSTELLANRAASILQENGAQTPDADRAPLSAAWIN